MTVLLNSEIFILTLVIGVYLAAVWLFRKTRLSILNPLLVSIPVLALITHFLGISYESFEKGSRIISFMLGPTVVVLGYLLYEQIAQLKENAVSIITSVFVGCITGVLSVIFIARYFGADHALIASLEPKSVTTPIAMSIAERSGGIPAIAARGGDCRRYFRWLGRSFYSGAFRNQKPDCAWVGFRFCSPWSGDCQGHGTGSGRRSDQRISHRCDGHYDRHFSARDRVVYRLNYFRFSSISCKDLPVPFQVRQLTFFSPYIFKDRFR